MRFSEIFYWAREVMFATDLHSLPINPFFVCSALHIPVISYTEARNCGFSKIIEKISYMDVDGFCYKGGGDSYIIFYDDTRTPKARINFTIAHELGHIALGHLKNAGIRPRYMTNRKNDPQEKDADVFAGELIRPPIPFVLTGCTRADDIQPVCNITYEAATVCSNLVQKMQERRDNPYFSNDFRFYHEQFFDFLYAKYCGRCRHMFVSTDAKFCPMCGNDRLQWFNERLPLMVLAADGLRGELVVQYREYPVNEQNQVIRCIRCDNEDLRPEDRYCKICSAPVYNYCAGRYFVSPHGDRVLAVDQACGAPLPSNARYCTHCGGVSAFYHAQLLSDWQSESPPIELPEPPEDPPDFDIFG